MNSCLALITILSSDVQLLIKCSSSINESIPFLLQDWYARALCKTFLFPFWKGTILLVDCALLSWSYFLLLVDAHFESFIFSFESLIVRNGRVNLSRKISDFLVSCIHLDSNSLNLLRYLDTFFCLVCILVLKHLQFILTAANHRVLTVNLSLKVTPQNCNALFISFSSSVEILNLSFQSGKVSFTQLVRLYFSSVSCNYSLSDILTDLGDLILFLVLLLDFLMFKMFSLFSLLTMLFIMTECWSVSSDIVRWWHWWWNMVSISRWWRMRSNWRTFGIETSSISLGICWQISFSWGISLLSMVRPPESLRRRGSRRQSAWSRIGTGVVGWLHVI